MLRVLLAVGALVAVPSLSAAQTARPGIDCSLLTSKQAVGLPCASTPRQAPVFVGPRDFPTVDFGRLVPGDPVPGQPGKVFRHVALTTGGGGWFVADGPPSADPALPTGDPLIDEACQPTPNPYSEPDRANLCFLMVHRREVQPTSFQMAGVYQERDPARVLVITEIRVRADGQTEVIGRWLRHEDPQQRGRLYMVQAYESYTRIAQ